MYRGFMFVFVGVLIEVIDFEVVWRRGFILFYWCFRDCMCFYCIG